MNFKCCKINDLNLENKEFVSSSIKCPEKEGGKEALHGKVKLGSAGEE